MTINGSLRARIAAGDKLLGTVIGISSPPLVEIVGTLGFDYVVLDREHGSFTNSQCEEMIRAADSVGLPAVVRVPRNARDVILRALDLGAAGVQVPHVSSAADVDAALRAALYHPDGDRSLAMPRAAGYGASLSISEYAAVSNAAVVLIGQVEEQASLGHLEEIVGQPRLDMVFIGRVDLSQSLAVPGQVESPVVTAAVDRIVASAAAARRPIATSVRTAEAAQRALEAGYQAVTVVVTTLLIESARSYLAAARRVAWTSG